MIDEADDAFPLTSDRYEIRVGLRPLRRKMFHIGDDFDRYRKNKLLARAERLGKYFQVHQLGDGTRRRVQSFLVDRFVAEFPEHFDCEHAPDGFLLNCRHTAEQLRFDPGGNLLNASTRAEPGYSDGIDALAMQVEDDLAVMHRSNGVDSASVIHLCSPNHWAAEDKIGKPFDAIHESVADIKPINEKSRQLVDAMIRAADGLERVAWGISTDRELNRHPAPPPDATPARVFDPNDPVAFLRVERQTMIGFPDVDALLFTIHTTFTDCGQVRQNAAQRERLVRVLQSMSPETAKYKGISPYRETLVRWLENVSD